MRGGNTRSYRSFPDIEEQVGYNPARFLDTPAPNEMNDLSPLATVEAFIRGMDAVETLRAWQHVEVALGQGQNGGPRQQVIKWLNHRKDEIDDTDETAPTDGSATTRESIEADTIAPTPTGSTEVVEQSPSDTEPTPPQPMAADGGATPDETPICPACRVALTREVISGEVGFWCPQCRDFREPATAEETA